ncbi:putative quinol monooxygenase [Aestuariispira insulae]|uniref:Quinol monooxygenase YgiN n=1 Tax=Aestuariispira insulae TaxID=1461337 RepID=A0A3D9HVH6_9PROT|nr:putative quinol monooxygenase [Aestuariispira insulae]RED53440.1 quinol monooxygenase YgiN [Aestuariispira insulae]
MSKIILSGWISVPAEKMAAMPEQLKDHIALTRAEPGNIIFNVDQDPDNPQRYTVYEEFVDQAAFDRHQERAKTSPWGAFSVGIERDYTIRTAD